MGAIPAFGRREPRNVQQGNQQRQSKGVGDSHGWFEIVQTLSRGFEGW